MDLVERIEKFESDRPMLYGLLKEQVGTTGIEALFIYLINTLDQQQVSVEPEVKPANENIYKIIKDKKKYYEGLLKENIKNEDYGSCFVCVNKIDAIIEIIADSLSV